MIPIPEDEWRRAFPVWLRTGRFPSFEDAETIECKFNPWHDPEDGRFTFAGTGRYHGRRSGEGSFGGGGAGGTWEQPAPKRRPANSPQGSSASIAPSDRVARRTDRSAQPVTSSSTPSREVVRNGYTYKIDPGERTTHVSGTLTLADVPVRSRTVQAGAGGSERRSTDDGGHYIAARFNGPAEAFNHFAQDAHFNRGTYRAMEDQWARAKRAGKSVTVRIVPRYAGTSIRPSVIDIWFTIDGHGESLKIPNERTEPSHAK